MLRGIESAKSGMMSILEYNDNIAHSLANANTIAFKQTKVAFKNIHDNAINAIKDSNNNLEQSNQIGTLSQGSMIDNYTIDFSQGPIKETGRALDLAIDGDGFFKTKMSDGTYSYTRNGVLHAQQDGTITDNQGNPIMNKNGIVKIRTTDDETSSPINFQKIVIRNNGEIYYNNTKYGQIDLYDFANKDQLVDIGEGRYVSSDENSNPATLMKNPNMEQFSLEMSNASPILTLINSMNAQRAYEATNNVMQSNSQTLQKSISSVGKAVG